MLVQAQVRNELLQLAVLVLELLHPPKLAYAKPAIHLLPAVEGLLRIPGSSRSAFRNDGDHGSDIIAIGVPT